MWYLIGHESEFTNEGDWVMVPPLFDRDDSTVAVARIDGEIVAWDGRCSHRGMLLYDGARGSQAPVCKYHGRRQRACNMRNRLVVVTDRHGWVYFGPPNAEFTATPIDEIEFPRLRLHSVLDYTYEAGWRASIENALESEHVPHVHAQSLGRLRIRRIDVRCHKDGSTVERFSSALARRLDATGRALKLPERAGEWDYIHHHLYPLTCLSSVRGWTWSLQHYWPVTENRTRFWHRLYVPADRPDLDDFFDGVAKLNERIFREDADILRHVPLNPYGDLEPHEDRIDFFRSYLSGE